MKRYLRKFDPTYDVKLVRRYLRFWVRHFHGDEPLTRDSMIKTEETIKRCISQLTQKGLLPPELSWEKHSK